MPIPLDHGRRPRPPASGRPRHAPAAGPSPCFPPRATGCAPPAQALRFILVSRTATGRTLAAAVTGATASPRRQRSGHGPDGRRRFPDPSVLDLLRSVLRAARRPPRALPLAAVLLAACCGGWLAGCAPSAQAAARANDPLAALAAPVQSPTFDLAFWVQEQATRSLLWRQAFAFCRLHPALPNCRTVRMASWWGSPPLPAPPPATAPPPAAPLPAPAAVPFPPRRQPAGSSPAAPPPSPRSREGRHS